MLTSCWGPDLSTAIYRLELGSGITHLDLGLASVFEGKEKEKEKYARKQVWSKYYSNPTTLTWGANDVNFMKRPLNWCKMISGTNILSNDVLCPLTFANLQDSNNEYILIGRKMQKFVKQYQKQKKNSNVSEFVWPAFHCQIMTQDPR